MNCHQIAIGLQFSNIIKLKPYTKKQMIPENQLDTKPRKTELFYQGNNLNRL